MIGSLPLFLNRYPDGELLAMKTILGVFPESYDRIVFAFLRETERAFGAGDRIKRANNDRFPVETVILDHETRGPAETVYETVRQASISGEFAVRDSHGCISVEKAPRGNFIAGLDLTQYARPIENLRDKSFIVLNEQGQVLDVVEKHFCSDVISVGLYGFRSSEDYLTAYEHLEDPNYPIRKLFVSHIISYLIGYMQRVFHSIRVSAFEDWSTKASWMHVQKGHATCFLDLDGVCGCRPPIEPKVLNEIRQLDSQGMRFVCFTARGDDNGVEKYLAAEGIHVAAVVCNCSFSSVRCLAKNADDIAELAWEL